MTMPKTVSASSVALVLSASLAVPAAHVHAQSWKPQKSVEFVVGSAPGGGTDITARTLQKIVQEQRLLEDVQVVNKPGGGQTVSWAYLNQHAGDAHYVSIINEPLITNRIMGVSDMDYTDFTPLALLFNEFVVFTAKPESPIKTGADMIGRLRNDLGALNFGQGSSRGNNCHISLGLLGKALGGDLKRQKMVVFKSGGETMTSVMGGHIDVGMSSIASAIQHIKAGRVQALAVTSEKRLDDPMASVPTFRDLGLDVVYGSWRVVFGPKGLSPAQIAYWEETLYKATRTADWRQSLDDNQQDSAYRPAASTRKFLDAEAERLRPLFAEFGLARQ